MDCGSRLGTLKASQSTANNCGVFCKQLPQPLVSTGGWEPGSRGRPLKGKPTSESAASLVLQVCSGLRGRAVAWVGPVSLANQCNPHHTLLCFLEAPVSKASLPLSPSPAAGPDGSALRARACWATSKTPKTSGASQPNNFLILQSGIKASTIITAFIVGEGRKYCNTQSKVTVME